MTEHPTPTLLIDQREAQDSDHGRKNGTPLRFNAPSEVVHLATGDYSIKGLEHLFAVETKQSLGDLVSSITTGRARFERELVRLQGLRFARILVIGEQSDILAHNYRSQIKPIAVINTLRSFSTRYGSIGIHFVPNCKTAVDTIENWAAWFAHQVIKEYGALIKGSPHLTETKKG